MSDKLANLSNLENDDLYRLKELYCPIYGSKKDWMECLKKAKEDALIETLENEITILKRLLVKLTTKGDI